MGVGQVCTLTWGRLYRRIDKEARGIVSYGAGLDPPEGRRRFHCIIAWTSGPVNLDVTLGMAWHLAEYFTYGTLYHIWDM